MNDKERRDTNRSLPLGWPKDVPLPTVEEAEEARRNAEEMIARRRDARKGKLAGTDPDMFKTQVTI